MTSMTIAKRDVERAIHIYVLYINSETWGWDIRETTSMTVKVVIQVRAPNGVCQHLGSAFDRMDSTSGLSCDDTAIIVASWYSLFSKHIVSFIPRYLSLPTEEPLVFLSDEIQNANEKRDSFKGKMANPKSG
ncbi:predicted protein [Histoplasma capsulatum G186AR]|uniref:Uncharacterized protein n=1 Tax=Ajellomyces capsulatus (strain G186AR / H82 / ATCC MYA-2454 / RMSCC 2432) TaxID=447093 RepID=C0NMX6_AJECG|nr:uncharacterized protein HCBG_04103 [Histoplasma capsulatum G186AR]EEH07224.1 predicted protein [Histoplasma capsulatum G186AR]